jgi:hypothetical protein
VILFFFFFLAFLGGDEWDGLTDEGGWGRWARTPIFKKLKTKKFAIKINILF